MANPTPNAMALRLAAIWQRSQPQVLERVMLLERAAAAQGGGRLTPELQAEALATAHKLAGMLGMFGFDGGTEIAREMEEALGEAVPGNLGPLAARLRGMLFPEA